MSEPLASRVVEVISTREDDHRDRYGSGIRVTGRTILTAAHVVDGADRVRIRTIDKTEIECDRQTLVSGVKDQRGPDLAIIDLCNSAATVSPLDFARLDRSGREAEFVDGCAAIGYPVFAERPAALGHGVVRDVCQVWGRIGALSRAGTGLITLDVSSAPTLPTNVTSSPWEGMSGAPAISNGRVFGVVTEHGRAEGPSALTITPVTAIDDGTDRTGGVLNPSSWWRRLGVAQPESLPFLGSRREHSAYPATLREIRSRFGILEGRNDWLDRLTAFSKSTEGYLWIRGRAWAGKTALLAEAATGSLPTEADVISYFLSRREGKADSNILLTTVVEQLASLLNEDVPESSQHQFNRLWQKAAHRAASSKRPLVLLVDGLDEDLRPRNTLSVPAVLPAAVAGTHEDWLQAHVIVTSRDEYQVPKDVPFGHPIRSAPENSLHEHESALDLATLAEQEIDSLKESDSHFSDLLAALAAAAGPLSIADLAELTGFSWQTIQNLLSQASRTFYFTAKSQVPRYYFRHEELLRRAQSDITLPIRVFQTRILEWADSWRDKQWQSTDEEVPHYLLGAYLGILYDDTLRLGTLVSDPNWIAAAVTTAGADFVLAELRTALAAAPDFIGLPAAVAAIRGQMPALKAHAYDKRDDPEQVIRQLCLQAGDLGDHELEAACRARLATSSGPVPEWVLGAAGRTLSTQIARLSSGLNAVAEVQGSQVVVGTDDGGLRVIDTSWAGRGVYELGFHREAVRALTVLPDGRIVSASHDRRILLWSLAAAGIPPHLVGQHDGPVRALATHNSSVLSGGDDGRLLMWSTADSDSGTPGTEIGRHRGPIRALAVRADGLIASGGDDHRVHTWDIEAGPKLVERSPLLRGRITTLAFNGIGDLVLGTTDGLVCIWRPGHHHQPVTIGTHSGAVRTITILNNGSIVSGGDDRRLRMWDPAPTAGTGFDLGRHRGAIRSVTSIADERVLSASSDHRLRACDPLRLVGTTGHGTRPTTTISAIAADESGRLIAAEAAGRVWEWESGSRSGRLRLSRDSAIVSLDINQKGQVSAVDMLGNVFQFGAENHAERLIGQHLACDIVAFDDGCCTGGYDGQVLLHFPDPAPAMTLHRHRFAVAALACTADGRIISADVAGEIAISDPNSAERKIVFNNRTYRINAIASLGTHIAVGGDTGTVSIVRFSDGIEDSDWVAHRGWVTAICMLQEVVVTAGSDGRVAVWRHEGQQWRQVADIYQPVRALASGGTNSKKRLVLAHADLGLSVWLI